MKKKAPKKREKVAVYDGKIGKLPVVLSETDIDFWLKERFLKGFLMTGTDTGGLRQAGVTRGRLNEWRKEDKVFNEAYDDVLNAVADELEEVAMIRAKEGSDPLMVMLLRSLRPQKYKEVKRIEATGADGGPLEHDHVVSAREQLSRRLQDMRDRKGLIGGQIPGGSNGERHPSPIDVEGEGEEDTP